MNRFNPAPNALDLLWVIMPILCQFYANSMPILCQFYANSMPILCKLTTIQNALVELAGVPQLMLEAHHPPAAAAAPSHFNSPPPSPPDSGSESDAYATSENDDDEGEDGDDDGELAGYEFCFREAIRYLLEEERLDRNHPVIRQIQEHLTRGRFHLLLNSGNRSIPDSAN